MYKIMMYIISFGIILSGWTFIFYISWKNLNKSWRNLVRGSKSLVDILGIVFSSTTLFFISLIALIYLTSLY